MTKGRHRGRGNNDDFNYAPPHPESEAAAVSSYLNPAIMFTFEGEKAIGGCGWIH